MATADNVTRYNNQLAGVANDPVPDGYIKCQEQVWLDSYTIAFTLTKTTLDIAVLPANKKITGIQVVIETSVSQTNGSLALGFSTDSAYGSLMEQSKVAANLTVTTIGLLDRGYAALYSTTLTGFLAKLSAFQKVISGTQNTITLQFNNWTMTTGTVKSIVRYT